MIDARLARIAHRIHERRQLARDERRDLPSAYDDYQAARDRAFINGAILFFTLAALAWVFG